MSLYEEWGKSAAEYSRQYGEQAFWKQYSEVEKEMYKKFLSEYKKEVKGKVEDLAKEFDVTPVNFVAFLDGINSSLVKENDVEKLELDSDVQVKADFEKLYFNMLDAKADYLYNLSQWDEILTEEKRKEITKEWRSSKVVVVDKVGRNDLCPCGSGKKYKKCCGK
jgi:preprotein translocase subunit SecA